MIHLHGLTDGWQFSDGYRQYESNGECVIVGDTVHSVNITLRQHAYTNLGISVYEAGNDSNYAAPGDMYGTLFTPSAKDGIPAALVVQNSSLAGKYATTQQLAGLDVACAKDRWLATAVNVLCDGISFKGGAKALAGGNGAYGISQSVIVPTNPIQQANIINSGLGIVSSNDSGLSKTGQMVLNFFHFGQVVQLFTIIFR